LVINYSIFGTQVFDLEVETPDKVLQRIYLNLERLKDDSLASKIRDKLKIIVSYLHRYVNRKGVNNLVICH